MREVRFRRRCMSFPRLIHSFACLAAVAVGGTSAFAQQPSTHRPLRDAAHAASDTARQPAPDPVLRALHWRLVGPFRGGRVVAVTGDPETPLVFYFGAVDGGVWKTTNGGQSWRNITDEHSTVASVGAIAVAP